MLLDLSTDFTQLDNVEAVTLERVRRVVAPPDPDPLLAAGPRLPPYDAARAIDAGEYDVIPVAKRRALNRKELAASSGAYTAGDQVWIIPVALLSGSKEIKPGDVVQSDSLAGDDPERWTVLEAQLGKARNTYRLTCRDLTIAYDLRDVINIERPRVTKDAAGAHVLAFPSDVQQPGGEVLYSGLICKVQPTEEEIVEERGVRGTQQKYDVIVSRQVAVVQYDRIAWTVGASTTYLDILTVEHQQEITALPVIKAVRKV